MGTETGAADGSGDGSGDGSSNGGGGGGSIHVTQPREARHNYDPVTGPRAFTRRISNHIFDGLYEYGEGLEIVPKLAASEPEVERDGTRYVVEIVDDAEFHNGDPVTAEDVVYSFTAPVEEQTAAAGKFSIIDTEATEAIDDTTVQFELTNPYTPFETITLVWLVVNKSAREEDPEAYNSNPIGSGHFEFVEHVSGEYTDIERWDDYWDEPTPNLESIRWVTTTDNAARTSQILAGDTDMVVSIPPADYGRLQNEDQVDTYVTPGIVYEYITYRCHAGPTANPDVRDAIEHAIPMGTFVEQTVGEMGIQLRGPLPEPLIESWGFPGDEYASLINEYDADRAADLLSGNVPDGWQPTFVAGGGLRKAMLDQLGTRLRQLEGVSIDPEVINPGPARGRELVYSDDPDDAALYNLGWAGKNDPDSFIYNLFHESQEGTNQGHFYANSEFHEKIAQARTILDRDQRFDLYDEVCREALNETIHTPTFTTGISLATRSSVQDVELHDDADIPPRFVSSHHNVSME